MGPWVATVAHLYIPEQWSRHSPIRDAGFVQLICKSLKASILFRVNRITGFELELKREIPTVPARSDNYSNAVPQ